PAFWRWGWAPPAAAGDVQAEAGRERACGVRESVDIARRIAVLAADLHASRLRDGAREPPFGQAVDVGADGDASRQCDDEQPGRRSWRRDLLSRPPRGWK